MILVPAAPAAKLCYTRSWLLGPEQSSALLYSYCCSYFDLVRMIILIITRTIVIIMINS